MGIFVNILANAAAIWAASRLINGFVFQGDLKDLLIAGIVLGIVNSFIRPVIKLLSLPLIILTLGLFTIVINIGMLYLVDSLLPTLYIRGFWAAFWGVIVISIVNPLVLSIFNKTEEKKYAESNKHC